MPPPSLPFTYRKPSGSSLGFQQPISRSMTPSNESFMSDPQSEIPDEPTELPEILPRNRPHSPVKIGATPPLGNVSPGYFRQPSPSQLQNSGIISSPKYNRSLSTLSMRSDSSFVSGIGASGGSATVSLELQLDNLRKKLRIMEKKRMEDRDKILRLQSENKDTQRLENIVGRLQAKLAPMHDEVVSLRTKLQESETERTRLLQSSASQDEILEMATLDREMAEEKLENLLVEINELKEEYNNLEIEYEALREENALYEELRASGELGSIIPGDNFESSNDLSIDNAKLSKKNDQLQAALLKIRDVMQEQEKNHKDEIDRLSDNASSAKSMTESYKLIQEQLKDAEDIIYDLRVQLDDALGAEDIIENLSEKNQELTEKCSELQHTIDELETLKALSDELESNHILTEKQLMLELDELEALHNSNEIKLNEAQERNAYLESAIVKFREVVTTLESDLEELRTNNQLINADSAAMAVHTKSLMELNMKLNNTALEANSKTMDLQLRKFEAEQAIEHLSIVKCYLSDGYLSDESSINALLRLDRICFMSQVIEDYLLTRVNSSADNLIPIIPYVKIILSLGEIKRYASLLAYYLRHSDPDEFKQYSQLYSQTEPIERIFSSVIDILHSNNLQEDTFLHELEDALHQLWTLYEDTRKQSSKEPRHEQTMNDLNQIQLTPQFIRDIFLQIEKILSEINMNGISNIGLDGILNQISSFMRVKVFATKLSKELSLSYENELMIPPSFSLTISNISTKCRSLIQFFIQVFEDVQNHTNDSGQINLTEKEIFGIFKKRVEKNISGKDDCTTPSHDDQNNTVISLITQELQTIMNQMKEISSTDTNVFEPIQKSQPPWKINADKLKEIYAVQNEKEKEVVELKAQLQKLATSLRARDKSIEEFEVKVGLLNSKMQKSKEQAEMITELKNALTESFSQEQKLKDSIEKLRKSLIDQEVYLTEKWKKEGLISLGDNINDSRHSENVKIEEISTAALKNEIQGLKETINHLNRVYNVSNIAFKNQNIDFSWLDFDSKKVIRVNNSTAYRSYRKKVHNTLLDARKSLLEFQPSLIKKPEQVIPSIDRRNRTERQHSLWIPKKIDPNYVVASQRDTYFKVRLIIKNLASLEI